MKCILSMVLTLVLVLGGLTGRAADPKGKDVLQGKPLGDWIAALKSGDKNQAAQARQVITRLGPKAREAVPVLVEQLREDLAGRRNLTDRAWEITRALSAIGPEAKPAVPLLAPMLERGDWYNGEASFAILNIGASPEEEKAAVRVLLLRVTKCQPSLLLGNPEYVTNHAAQMVPALTSLLADKEDSCRQRAAAALAILGTKGRKAADALESALRDPSVEVRAQAAYALVLVEPARKQQGLEVLLALVRESKAGYQAAQFLGSLGAEAVPTLLGALRESIDNQEPLLGALQQVGEPAVAGLIKELDGTLAGRIGAARALGMISSRGRPVLEALQTALKDADERVRFYSAQSLAALDTGSRDAVLSILIDLSGSKTVWIRHDSAQVLKTLGPKARPALAALKGLLKDSGKSVRRQAALALAALDLKEAIAGVPALVESLTGKKSGPDIEAIQVLTRIGKPAAAALPALRNLLDSTNQGAFYPTAMAIVRIDPGQTGAVVKRLLSALSKQGDSEDILQILGEIGPGASAAVPVIKERLNDPKLQPWEKMEWQATLVKIDPSQSGEILTRLKADLQSKNRLTVVNAINVLCEIAPIIPEQTVPVLVEVLNDKKLAMRHRKVINVLIEIGAPAKAAVPALQKLLKEPEGNLKDVAAAALRAIQE